MQISPIISVVMPVYNAENFLKEAIDSILHQSISDFEFIIINDGSTDGSKKIITSYDDKRIIYVENDENKGISYSLNKGIDLAKGEYIARMDSDDVALQNRFERQLLFLKKNPEIALLGTFGKGFGIWDKNIQQPTEHLKIKDFLLFENPFIHPSVFIKRKILEEKALRYDEILEGAEDYDLFAKIADIAEVRNLPEYLINYRFSKFQVSYTSIDKNFLTSPKTRDTANKIRKRNIEKLVINGKPTIDQDFLKIILEEKEVISKKELIKIQRTINLLHANNEKLKIYSPNIFYPKYIAIREKYLEKRNQSFFWRHLFRVKRLKNRIQKKVTSYITFHKLKKRIQHLDDLIFIFPRYSFGGAERVHLDILGFLKEYKTTCIITSFSRNKGFKEKFINSVSNFIDLSNYENHTNHPIFLKALAEKINAKKSPIIFGWETTVFYNLIPYLEPHVRIIDITHGFTYEMKNTLEYYSLTHVPRINHRVILGNRDFNDYKNLYENINIDTKYLDRLKVIKNMVKAPLEYPTKPINNTLKILFVARNNYQKRPEMIFEIAKRCNENAINVEFFVIGDFSEIEHPIINMHFLGVILDEKKLAQYYLEADLILLTSLREGLPMVILEAMAYGCVPIINNVGEMPEVINNQTNNGTLIIDKSIEFYLKSRSEDNLNEGGTYEINSTEYDDLVEETISKFVESIEKYSHNRSLLKKHSLNAYLTVKTNFSEEQNKKAYLELFGVKETQLQ